MKTKYVCHGLISLHVNFHDNRKKRTVTSNIKIYRWGGGGGGGKKKEPQKFALFDARFSAKFFCKILRQ